MEEKNTKKKNIILSMLFSLLCVFLVTIPTLTFAWFKQYMDVTSQKITITSGESVAYIEIEIFAYQNGQYISPTIKGAEEGRPLHSTFKNTNVNCTATSDNNTGLVVVEFKDISVSNIDLTNGYYGLNNPDFFNPDCLPEFIIEFRIIKEIFSSYVKSSYQIKQNEGKNYYYDSSYIFEASASDPTNIAIQTTTPPSTYTQLDSPFNYRQSIFENNTLNPNSICITSPNTEDNSVTNLDIVRNSLPKSMPNILDDNGVEVHTNLFDDYLSLKDQDPTIDSNDGYIQQMYVPQFNKKPNGSNDVGYSKAILYDICLDPSLILFTMQETNKSVYTYSMTFDLSLEFTFELSNDPFRI
ncbi:MAG: hypothetical protein ACI31I_05760 [Bacilli bacterium]